MGVYIPVELRKRVYTRAEGCCEYCGIPEQMGWIPHHALRAGRTRILSPIVSGANLLYALLVMAGNLLIDLIYPYLDPRVRYQ